MAQTTAKFKTTAEGISAVGKDAFFASQREIYREQLNNYHVHVLQTPEEMKPENPEETRARDERERKALKEFMETDTFEHIMKM